MPLVPVARKLETRPIWSGWRHVSNCARLLYGLWVVETGPDRIAYASTMGTVCDAHEMDRIDFTQRVGWPPIVFGVSSDKEKAQVCERAYQALLRHMQERP